MYNLYFIIVGIDFDELEDRNLKSHLILYTQTNKNHAWVEASTFVWRKPRGGLRNAGILIRHCGGWWEKFKEVSSDGVISGIVQLGREILC
jgi:hypothetical protein